jgi:hypothetical protein
VPQCSETIGAIAAALAKAQSELTNPEKTLVATLPASGRDQPRSFRYASLASGLDVVRKALSRQEIAVVQTTEIDRESGIIRLKTVLAHSSGEWLSSLWPVCPIAETANPQRMGAALTYARRYALFTLVGIAGEDDLDAPDLATDAAPVSTAAPATRGNGSATPTSTAVGGRERRIALPVRNLSPAESAARREELLTELAVINSAEGLVEFAHRAMARKNALTTEDAARIEAAFHAAVSKSAPEMIDDGRDDGGARAAAPQYGPPLIKRSRKRNKAHLDHVAAQPCLICGRRPSDAHHLRFAQSRALGRKVSDEFTVPLCRVHHRELHSRGNEREWWATMGCDPLAVAEKLWQQTHEIVPSLAPAQPVTDDVDATGVDAHVG